MKIWTWIGLMFFACACAAQGTGPKEHHEFKRELVDLTRSAYSFQVRSNDWQRVQEAKVILSTRLDIVNPSVMIELKRIVHAPHNDEWISLVIPTSAWQHRGHVNLRRIKHRILRVVADPDVTVEFRDFQPLPLPPRRAMLSLTIDDGLVDGMPGIDIMRRHGLQGSLFVEPASVGQPGFLSQTQLSALAAEGWDVGGHMYAVDPARLSPAELDSTLKGQRQWLSRFPGGALFAYPNGRNPGWFRDSVARHYDAALTITMLSNLIGQFDAHRISRRSIDATDELEEVKRAIDRAHDAGEWLILNFHVFKPTSDVADNVTPEFFNALCEHIRRRNIPVLTVSAALRELNAGIAAQ